MVKPACTGVKLGTAGTDAPTECLQVVLVHLATRQCRIFSGCTADAAFAHLHRSKPTLLPCHGFAGLCWVSAGLSRAIRCPAMLSAWLPGAKVHAEMCLQLNALGCVLLLAVQ